MIISAISPSVIFYFFVGIFGLLTGSFLNVIAYRLPLMIQASWPREYKKIVFPISKPCYQQLTLLFPRSHCRHCQHSLKIFDIIPLASYFFAKRKCRYCSQKISSRYALLELLSALTTIIIFWKFGLCWQGLFAFIFAGGLLTLATIDWEQGILPDEITLSLLWLGLIVSLGGYFCDCKAAITGAILGYCSLWLVAWIYLKITKKSGMGYGDFKLFALLGAWLGWQQLPFIIFIASFLGSIGGISLIVLKKQHRDTPIAFGPYLALAGWIALLWGKPWPF